MYLAAEVHAEFVGGTIAVDHAIADEDAASVQADLGRRTVGVDLAATRWHTGTLTTDLAGGAVHVADATRVRRALPVDADFVGLAVEIAEALGGLRLTESVVAEFVGRTIVVGETLDVDGLADSLVAEGLRWAAAVTVARDELAKSFDANLCVGTFDVVDALHVDALEILANLAHTAVDIIKAVTIEHALSHFAAKSVRTAVVGAAHRRSLDA